MGTGGFWAVLVPPEIFESERLYAHESLALESAEPTGAAAVTGSPRAGDAVALIVATEELPLVGLGMVVNGTKQPTIRYTHRLFDDPLPVRNLPVDGLPARLASSGGATGGRVQLAEDEFARIAAVAAVGQRVNGSGRAEWFVSVALPIEASSRAEAVREFWTYVEKLGPQELPAFVWPRGDELAMQAYLLGAEVNLDPEADD